MSIYLGDFPDDHADVNVIFTTNDKNGGVIAPSTAFETADVKVYRNDTATPRSSTAGQVMTSPFNSVVGQHQVNIDLSDNTDAGFYAPGFEYQVMLEPDETIDGETVLANIAQFSIERTGGVLALIKAGNLSANVVQISGDGPAADNAEAFFDGTGYAGTGNVIPTVTTLTNLPAITANWLTATGIDADAITEAKIADNAIAVEHIATDAITADKIAANAITSSELADGAITAAKFGAGAIDATAIATDAIDADALATDAVNEIVDQVWDELLADHLVDGSFGLANNALDAGTAQAGTSTTIQLDAGSADNNADLYTGCLVMLVGGTGIGQSRLITDYAANRTATITPAWDTDPDNTTKYVIMPFGSVNVTTLPTIPTDWLTADGLAGDAVNEIADQVWDEALADHTADGSFGLANHVLELGTAQSGTSSTIVLDNGSASATADLYNGCLVRLLSGPGAGQARLITDYASNKTATVEPDWITDPDNTTKYAVFPAGNANLRTASQTSLDAIETDTDELQQDWTNAGRLDLILDDILLDTAEIGPAGAGLTNIDLPNQTMDIVGNITGALSGSVGSVAGNVDGSVGSLAAQAKADVNAEVDTALDTTTYAEPAKGDPGATISLAQKIGFLYKAWRNKSEMTASVYSLYNDDAATVDHDAAVSDDTTTATRGEMTDGP